MQRYPHNEHSEAIESEIFPPLRSESSIVREGHYRWPQVRELTRLSRPSWRSLYEEGKAPAPRYLLGRAYWIGAELIEWLQDPHSYSADRKLTDKPASPNPLAGRKPVVRQRVAAQR